MGFFDKFSNSVCFKQLAYLTWCHLAPASTGSSRHTF